MTLKAWIDDKIPRFFLFHGYKDIVVMASGRKPVISPTYYYPAVPADY